MKPEDVTDEMISDYVDATNAENWMKLDRGAQASIRRVIAAAVNAAAPSPGFTLTEEERTDLQCGANLLWNLGKRGNAVEFSGNDILACSRVSKSIDTLLARATNHAESEAEET